MVMTTIIMIIRDDDNCDNDYDFDYNYSGDSNDDNCYVTINK